MQISPCLCVGPSWKASLRKVFSPVWEKMHKEPTQLMACWSGSCVYGVCGSMVGSPSFSACFLSQPSTLGLTPVCQLVSSVCSAFPYCLCLPQPTNVLTAPVAQTHFSSPLLPGVSILFQLFFPLPTFPWSCQCLRPDSGMEYSLPVLHNRSPVLSVSPCVSGSHTLASLSCFKIGLSCPWHILPPTFEFPGFVIPKDIP